MKRTIEAAVIVAGVLMSAGAGYAAGMSSSLFNSKDKGPVPEWGMTAAKTATPATVGTAGSVLLYSETVVTVDEQGHAVERERTARRILKPQGREDGVCVAWYEEGTRINLLRGWTITGDGRQLQALEPDYAEFGDTQDAIMLTTKRTRVARPPGVDPGAVVVCESESTYPTYIQEVRWSVQHDVPAVTESLEVDLPAGQHHAETWRGWPAVKAAEVQPGHFRWQVDNVPGLDLRLIPGAPAWRAVNGRMTVQWGDAAVDGTEAQWHAIGAWMEQLEAHKPDPTAEITAKAQALVAGAPDFYTKLSRISEYVQRDYRYFIVMRGIGGLQAHPAEQIYRNRYGDCKDKSTITISLLGAVGVPAHYVFVDTERGVISPENPSLVGNHMITAIEIPEGEQDARLRSVVTGRSGKRYLIFDPTNERTPLGVLPTYLQGGYGGLAAGTDSGLIALPVLAAEANGTERTGTFTLSADGTLAGSVETLHRGPVGGELRRLIKETDEKQRHDILEHSLGEQVPGVTLESYKFIEPEHFDQPIELDYKVTARQYGRAMGALFLVRPRVVGELAAGFDNKPRTLPIELEQSGHWHEVISIALPEGFAVDELPDGAHVEMDFAAYKSSYTVEGRTLKYERDYTVKQVHLPAERAGDFRRLESAIVADERATAVLKKQ